MKKRLRKKLRVAEFQELCFALNGKLAEMNEEQENNFFNRFFDLCESCGLLLDGVFCTDSFDLLVVTGVVGSENEERRTKFLEQLKDFAEITEFDASNLE